MQSEVQVYTTRCFIPRECSTLYRFSRVQFDYQNPTPNFDRSKVKGSVAKLIRVKDLSTATALEVTAGSKVRKGNNNYNSVVKEHCHR